MLWRMSADLRRQGIGMTFINIDTSTTRSVGGQMTGGKGGKVGNPFPSPYSGTQELPVVPAGRRARSCRVPWRRSTKPVAEIAENAEIPVSRPLRRGRRDILRADALPLGIDLAQHHQHPLGHHVARDALALGLELLHVDPHRVKG